MGKRIRLGNLSGSTYGLKVSKEGQDVDSATGKNLLFDSTAKAPLYFGRTQSLGTTINHSLGTRSNFDSHVGYITHNNTKLQYNRLCVVLEDATGQNLSHAITNFSTSSSGIYSSVSGYVSRLGVVSTSIFTETIKETAAMYRMSAFYALSGTEGSTVSSTNNSYSMYAPTTVTANSGDHPASDVAAFNPSNSINQRYNTHGNSVDVYKSDVTDNNSNDFGHNLRLEFRKSSGEANNDKFFYRDNGTFYTVTKSNLGGVPITNAKVAVSNIPLGYGFMNSTFMGF